MLKSKGHMNFYECCDLTEKIYLDSVMAVENSFQPHQTQTHMRARATDVC